MPRLYYRQKILLALIQVFGGNVKNIDLQEYLFLFTKLFQKDPSYHFVPFKYGCFSFQSYADRRKLVELGVIEAGEDGWQLKTAEDFIGELKLADQERIGSFHREIVPLQGDALVKRVYEEYPYYAINSKIADHVLEKTGIEKIAAERKEMNQGRKYRFYTIGYEGKAFEQYLNQLITHDIRLLCDVRKNPLSRKYGFSRKVLQGTLNDLGIEYLHMPELGITSNKRQSLETQADYDRLFSEYERTTLKKNKASLERLKQLMKAHKRIAITCFEGLPCQCHRGRVAQALAESSDWQYPVNHL